VRFRSKSCLFFDPDGQNQQRGLVVAIDAAKVPAGECGVENQVGRVGVSFLPGIPCDETYLRPLGL
jgi:hypothetical protein